MYIRWQSRKRKSQFGSYRDLEMAWRAVLVESVRVDGKPKQRHIGYLVGFTESAIAIPAQQRFVWDRIEARLARIGSNRISAEDRETIMASIAEKIGPPPTREQREELDRQREAFLGAFKFAFSNKLRRRSKRLRTAP
jgi:hypothetical protein